MKLSELIAKPVLSPSGERLGYVVSFLLSAKNGNLTVLVCADEEETSFFLPVRALQSVGDAILAGAARVSAPTGIPSPIGKTVYTQNGSRLGIVRDVLESDGKCYLHITGTSISVFCPFRCAEYRDAVILRACADKRGPKKSERPKNDALPLSSVAQPKNNPRCALYDRDLLGKVLQSDITDGDGIQIAAAGDCITPSLLDRAAAHNRLLELGARIAHPPEKPKRGTFFFRDCISP